MLDKANIKIALGSEAYMRILREDDVSQDYLEAINDKSLTENMVSGGVHNETYESLKSYILHNHEAEDALLFGIFLADGTLIGTSRLHDIAGRMAWLGIFIFKNVEHGKGWGSRSVRAVSDYAFNQLGVNTIKAGIYQRNEASRRCFLKAGYHHECNDDTYQGPVREIWARGCA